MNSYASKPRRISRKVLVVTVLTLFLLSSGSAFLGASNSNVQGPPGLNKAAASGSATEYTVNFYENGLPSTFGYQWSVFFNNITERSYSSLISFTVPDGSYNFSIASLNNYYPLQSTGNVIINGSNKIVNIDFKGKTYLVTFKASDYSSINGGAKNYNAWTVDFNGISNTTQSSSMSFLVQNGTYSYSVVAPFGYTSTPSTGSVTVSGSNVLVPVVFNNSYYQVTFSQLGLPATTNSHMVPQWSVQISGASIPHTLSLSTISSTITQVLPAGTYTYTVGNPNGYYSSPGSGSFVVSKSSISENIQFTPLNYKLLFSEKGLPSTSNSGTYGTQWAVKIINTASHAAFTEYSQTSQIYFNVPNGTYAYYVLNLSEYKILQESGTVSVTGYNYQVPVQFSSIYSTVTFKESGLPSLGNPARVPVWKATLTNTSSLATISESTNLTALSFRVMPGSYTYAIVNIPGFSTSSPSGSFSVTSTYTVNEKFNVTANFYNTSTVSAVTFLENGLPTNTQWTVTLLNQSGSFSFSSDYQDIVAYVGEGFYFYTVASSGYFTPIVASGTFNSTSPVSITVNFFNSYRPLSFTESGLPYNTTWSVAVQNPDGTSNVFTSNTGSITAYVPNGTFIYRIQDVAFYHAQADLGAVFVDSSTYTPSGQVSLNFVNASSVLTFNELGLPGYSKWTVSILTPMGQLVTHSSTYGSMNFVVTNGTYWFFSYSVGFYNPSVDSSSITLYGSQKSVVISYTKQVQHINFNEKGLPAGTSWSAVLGQNNLGKSTTGSNITFDVNNGTYYFMILETGDYSSNVTSGLVYITGSGNTVNVTFAKRFYSVTFNETGLAPGTTWHVVVNGIRYSSSSTNLVIQRENGTYNFSLTGSPSYYPVPSDGLLNVMGSNVYMNISFKSQLYSLTFNAHGLPSGYQWSVTLGTQQNTSSSTKTFMLANGSYSYTVTGSNHYVPAPSSGTVTILGSNTVVNVTFTIYKYEVTFKSTSAVPANDTWYVNLTTSNGTVYTKATTGNSVSFNVINGTYSYRLASQNKSYTPGSGGSLTVNGKTQTIDFQFTLLTYGVTFRESGLPANATWYVIINGQNRTISSNNLSLQLENGTYAYTVVNIKGYNATVNTGQVIVKGSSVTVQVTYKPVSKTYKIQPNTTNSLPFNKIVLYILIGIAAIGLVVIFVVYTRGRRN